MKKLRVPTVVREDVHGVITCPADMAEFLTRVGGYNPNDEPMYRMNWAENIYDTQGGIWQEWAQGTPINERGGTEMDDEGHITPCTTKPLRIVTELREVLRYPNMVGWILERWEPANYFGTRLQWEGGKVPFTQIPFLGPYPEDGRYVLVAGPSLELPSTLELNGAIEETEFKKDEHRGACGRLVRERVNEAEWQYEQNSIKFRQHVEEVIKDQLSPWKRASLAAGRWRNEMAARAGVREHAGN